jgi:Spx/MgsR family transcriptional regulator
MSIMLYGIPNCDTVKKARTWLDQNDREVVFHDFKKAGVPAARLDAWMGTAGWERVLNRRGTAWRKLDEPLRESVVDAATAKAVMLANPSVIKRPVVEWEDGSITIGFDPIDWGRR